MTASDGFGTEIVDPLTLQARGRVGTVLRGKWRLDVLLGVGGMGSVYAATHRNGSRAAVKLLHPELSLNAEVRERFLREGLVANAVAHEGVVRVIDDDIAEDGSLFLAAELLDGETLEERRLRLGGHLSEDEVLSVIDAVLDALVAAHGKEIVHRDLKPENIFITRDGRTKILDFGIARLRQLSAPATATRTGAAMGTPAFMAPEQARGRWDDVDGRTDLWAVGATMFTLLTGRLVHDGMGTPNEVLLAAMTQPAPDLASIVPGVAPVMAHLVDRALAFDREKRWPTAKRMQEALRHAYHDKFGRPITTIPGQFKLPDSVVNRTVAFDDDVTTFEPRHPTTGQPVVAPPEPPAIASSVRRGPSVRTIVAGAAGLAVLAGVGLGAVLFDRSAQPPAEAAGAVPSASAPPPLYKVDDLPRATEPSSWSSSAPSADTARSTAPPAAVASPALRSSTAGSGSVSTPPSVPRPVSSAAPSPKPPATAKPGCDPPFDLVAGKKVWKEQCL